MAGYGMAPTPKIVGQDENAYRVQHPSGEIISVPMGTLAPQTLSDWGGTPAAPQPMPMQPPPQPMEASQPMASPQLSTSDLLGGLQQNMQTSDAANQLNMREFDAAGGQQRKAAQAMTQAQLGVNAAEQQAVAEQARVMEEENLRLAEQQKGLAAIQEASQKELGAQAQQVSAMKVDPNAFFKEKGTAATVGAAIMVGLNAIGNAFMGKGDAPNQAMSMINEAIDKNIQGQKENIMLAKSGLDDSRKLAADKANAAQSGIEQTLFMRNQMLEGAKLKTQQYMAAAKDDVTRANGDQLVANIAAQQAELQQKLIDHRSENYLKNAQLATGLVNTQMDADAARAKMASEKDAFGVSGWEGTAKSPKTQQEAEKMEGTYRTVMPLLDRVEKHYMDNGGSLYGEAKAKGKSLNSQAIGEFKNLLELGVLAGPDLEIVQGLMPDPNKFYTDGAFKSALQETRRYVDSKVNAYMTARGYTQRSNSSQAGAPVPGEQVVEE